LSLHLPDDRRRCLSQVRQEETPAGSRPFSVANGVGPWYGLSQVTVSPECLVRRPGERWCGMAADLASYVNELGLGEHSKFLLGIARPSVEIITAGDPVTRGCSKFGGSPDLPAECKWPHHKLGPYRFVGQINLADIPKGTHGLPGD